MTFVTEHGPLLGLVGATQTPTVTVPFVDDAMLVLVTDGLVERRRESIRVGLARLEEAVSGFSGSLEALCDLLLGEVGAGE